MNHNHELLPSPDQSEPEELDSNGPHEPFAKYANTGWDDLDAIDHISENTENIAQEETTNIPDEQMVRKSAQKVGKQTFMAAKRDSLSAPKERISTEQLAKEIKTKYDDVRALLKTEGYENYGLKLGNGTYLTKEEQEIIAVFFKDNINTKQLAQEIKINASDIIALLKTEGYENYGLKLGNGTYFTNEEQERIKAFFKENISTNQLAKKINFVSIADITALLKTEGYENCGLKLAHGIYFTKEEQERIKAFFKENISTKQLSQEIEISAVDIGALLKTEGYENCGLKLGHGIYFIKEEQEIIRAFFKNNKGTRQLAKEIKISPQDIDVPLKTEGYEKCGLKLGNGIYFTKEEQEIIRAFFKDKISTSRLSKEIDSSVETIDKITQAYNIPGIRIKTSIYYDKNQQVPEIIDLIEHESPKDSFPEAAIRFYLKQTGLKVDKIRPDWMKREATGRNLEIDAYIEFDNPPPPGFGIEYDGERWHPNPEYDASKNDIARKNGVEIIHIREKGCPPMRDDIPCIMRQDQKGDSLEECIKQVFEMLNLPLPETGINIKKDKTKILELAINKKKKANAYKSIKKDSANNDGIIIHNVNAA